MKNVSQKGTKRYLHASGIVMAADCGFTSPQAIWKHVINKNLHLPYALRGIMADSMFRNRLQMSTDEYSTIDALKCSKVPVLFAHGTEDHFVPIGMTYEAIEFIRRLNLPLELYRERQNPR